MTIRRKRIMQMVEDLLKESGITEPPIQIEQIAKKRGLAVRKEKIPDSDISGFLFRRGRDVFIGVNASHSPARQRFTIAHELGHTLLHGGPREELHVDRGFEVKFRDRRSSEGTDLEEREANLFAAEILMPRSFIAKDMLNADVDLVDDDFVDKLSSHYGVSNQALVFRLANLGYVKL